MLVHIMYKYLANVVIEQYHYAAISLMFHSYVATYVYMRIETQNIRFYGTHYFK